MPRIPLSEENTEKAMNNLDILMRCFGISKKEAENGVGISSGYLTRLANPTNGKNLSFDLQLKLEKFLDIPQFTLNNEDIEYPESDDEFIIKVMEKMNRQTRDEELKWKEIKEEHFGALPAAWNEIFMIEAAEDALYKGEMVNLRKDDSSGTLNYMVGSIFETSITEGNKMYLFETGYGVGDIETDYDEYGNPIPYRALDCHFELLMKTEDNNFRKVADDYRCGSPKKKVVSYSIRRLYNMVRKSTQNNITKETMDILSKYLNED